MPAFITVKTDTDAVEEFHQIFGQYIGTLDGTVVPQEVLKMRLKLIQEEVVEELIPALEKLIQNWTLENLTEVADGLADAKYVINGCAVALGIPFDAIFNEVHRSNMSKRNADGTINYRDDGKILKPETYSPPQIWKILLDHTAFQQILTQEKQNVPTV
jgi:predicted HAD superfamily Cof-like phosphohydrolase